MSDLTAKDYLKSVGINQIEEGFAHYDDDADYLNESDVIRLMDGYFKARAEANEPTTSNETALNIDLVSCFSNLENGDVIKEGDEFYNEKDEWEISDCVGHIFDSNEYNRHRRPNYS